MNFNSLYLTKDYEHMVETHIKLRGQFKLGNVIKSKTTSKYCIMEVSNGHADDLVTIIVTFGDNVNDRDLRGYEPFTVFNATLAGVKPNDEVKKNSRHPDDVNKMLDIVANVKKTLDIYDNEEAFEIAQRLLMGERLSQIIKKKEVKEVVVGEDNIGRPIVDKVREATGQEPIFVGDANFTKANVKGLDCSCDIDKGEGCTDCPTKSETFTGEMSATEGSFTGNIATAHQGEEVRFGGIDIAKPRGTKLPVVAKGKKCHNPICFCDGSCRDEGVGVGESYLLMGNLLTYDKAIVKPLKYIPTLDLSFIPKLGQSTQKTASEVAKEITEKLKRTAEEVEEKKPTLEEVLQKASTELLNRRDILNQMYAGEKRSISRQETFTILANIFTQIARDLK